MSGAVKEITLIVAGVAMAVVPLLKEIVKGTSIIKAIRNPYFIFLLLLSILTIWLGRDKIMMDQAQQSKLDSVNSKLVSNIEILLEFRKKDSTANFNFLKKLKDSFGIMRDSAYNSPVQTIYNTKIGKVTTNTFQIGTKYKY